MTLTECCALFWRLDCFTSSRQAGPRWAHWPWGSETPRVPAVGCRGSAEPEASRPHAWWSQCIPQPCDCSEAAAVCLWSRNFPRVVPPPWNCVCLGQRQQIPSKWGCVSPKRRGLADLQGQSLRSYKLNSARALGELFLRKQWTIRPKSQEDCHPLWRQTKENVHTSSSA